MKGDYLKFLVVGSAAYLIGFYEMKYKMTKSLLDVTIEQNKELKEKIKTEEA